MKRLLRRTDCPKVKSPLLVPWSEAWLDRRNDDKHEQTVISLIWLPNDLGQPFRGKPNNEIGISVEIIARWSRLTLSPKMCTRKIVIVCRLATIALMFVEKEIDDKKKLSMLRFQRKTHSMRNNNSSYRGIGDILWRTVFIIGCSNEGINSLRSNGCNATLRHHSAIV